MSDHQNGEPNQDNTGDELPPVLAIDDAAGPVPEQDIPGQDIAIARQGDVARLDPEGLEEVVGIDERMMQIVESGLNEGAEDDADEQLFQDAFGGMEDEFNEDEDALEAPAPEIEPVFHLPEAAIAAVAAAGGGQLLLEAGQRAGLPRVDVRHAMGMRQMSELPGYLGNGTLGQGIRALGRKIFGNLPCFERMAQLSRQAGQDPLGQVWVFSNIDPANPGAPMDQGKQARLDALLNWVRTNGGTMVDAAVIGFTSMPGYSANMILYATENESYLIVQETPRIGSPIAANYIYSWLGGMQVYRQDNNAEHPFDRMTIPDRAGRVHITIDRRALNAEAGIANPDLPAQPARVPQIPAPRPPERPQPQPVQAAPAPAPQAEARRHAPRPPAQAPARAAAPAPEAPAAPPAPARVLPPLQRLRDAGFSLVGTDSGPALSRTMTDGTVALVSGNGRSLALAKEFLVRLVDGSGNEISQSVMTGADEILQLFEAGETKDYNPG